jgi:toxin ParE1/3/4
VTLCLVQAKAEADLAAILDDLEQRAGPATAVKYAKAFDACLERLSIFPGLGAPRRRLGTLTRLSIVSPYLVFYDYDEPGDTVTVLRILHGRRKITKRLLRL